MAAGPNSMVALIIPMSSSSAGPKPQPPGQPPRPDQGLPGQLPRPEHPIYYPLPPGAPVDPAYGIPEDGPRPDRACQGRSRSLTRVCQGLAVSRRIPSCCRRATAIGSRSTSGGRAIRAQAPGLPGQQPKPDQGLPPIETPDIDLPGDAEWVVGWTPSTGWVSIAIVVPDKPVPTPSKKK